MSTPPIETPYSADIVDHPMRYIGDKKPDDVGALKRGGGGGTSDGMDPWQQSVETRLGELRADTRGIASDVGTMKGQFATLTERVGNLPTKDFIVKVTLGALALFAALSVFGPNIRTLLGIH